MGFPYRLAFELVDEQGHAFYLVFGTSSLKGVEKMKDAMWSVDRVHGTRFRDPRDPAQIAFEISPSDPDLRGLEHLLAEKLADGQPVQVGDLRKWTLESTMFRAPHTRKVLRAWRGKQWITTDDNRLTQTAVVRLIQAPSIGASPRAKKGMLDLPPAL